MSTNNRSGASFRLVWTIAAPPPEVFRAWTDPAQLKWFFNDSMAIPEEPIEVDLRIGGAWRQMMVINETTRYFTGGIYREIVPDAKLVFSWGAVGGWPELSMERLDESPLVTVLFRPTDVGTDLVLDVELPASISEQAAREGLEDAMRNGWLDTVNRLAAATGLPG
jgi:uncharacterized protein YndB with AHSA1/START domain